MRPDQYDSIGIGRKRRVKQQHKQLYHSTTFTNSYEIRTNSSLSLSVVFLLPFSLFFFFFSFMLQNIHVLGHFRLAYTQRRTANIVITIMTIIIRVLRWKGHWAQGESFSNILRLRCWSKENASDSWGISGEKNRESLIDGEKGLIRTSFWIEVKDGMSKSFVLIEQPVVTLINVWPWRYSPKFLFPLEGQISSKDKEEIFRERRNWFSFKWVRTYFGKDGILKSHVQGPRCSRFADFFTTNFLFGNPETSNWA